MNDFSEPSDAAARRAALDVTRSFIVQAPAGSGKTELLIQRILALLAQVQRPEAIVAMTFTRKAAAEMQERIVVALRSAASSPEPGVAHHRLTWNLARAVLERDALLGWKLLEHPSRLQVQTIDAFCAAVMRQAPLTTKVGAVPRFVEDAQALYAEAARADLDTTGDDPAWKRLLEHVDNDADRAVELIAGMLAKREQWLPYLLQGDRNAFRDALERTLAQAIESELNALRAAIPSALVRPLLELARHAASNLKPGEEALSSIGLAAALPDAKVGAAERWRILADWLLYRDKTAFVTSVDIRRGFPPGGKSHPDRSARKAAMKSLLAELAAIPGLARAFDRVRRLPPPRYDDESWSFIAALLDILPRCVAQLGVAFARSGSIDFAEATLIALRALGEHDAPSDLLLALDTRIEHVLVDEFQDTSIAQYDLIERLTAGWTGSDGRTLFLVGDPMQSIYRFREAEVSLFLSARAKRRIGSVELVALTLSRNFRSQRGLVQWVNRIFPSVLAPRDDALRGAVAFRPASPAREGVEGDAVTLDICVGTGREARAVVARVREALANGAESVAVLVRKRMDLADILPALRDAGIAYSAVELDRLSERQAVLDLCSLTHALVQPYDRLAWLSALRAPWCGLTLADLFAVSNACAGRTIAETIQDSSTIGDLSEDGERRLQGFAGAVSAALAHRGRASLSVWVRAVWLAVGGPASVAEPIDLTAARCFFSLLAEHSVGADVPDWPAFVAALDSLHAEEDPDALAAVRVMTLHRAKGLEFDVVVMPGLGKSGGSSDPQLLRWRWRKDGWLLAPIKARSVGPGDDDPVHAYLKSLASDEEAAELGRLLYVGCTRAKQRLHLSATLDVDRGADGGAQWRPPKGGTALGMLWSALAGNGELPPCAVQGETAPRRATGVPLRRLAAGWRMPIPPSTIEIEPSTTTVTLEQHVEFDWARETARQIGILAHRLLHALADEGLDVWPEHRIAAEAPRITAELSAVGFTRGEADIAVAAVLRAVGATLADSRGRWLFDPGHAEVHAEYALTALRDGRIVRMVIDRTFVDAAGVCWIVDFKLSRHEGGEPEAFLDRERERYRGQLEAYAQTMRALEKKRTIRLGLYFPLLGGWREWDAPA